MKKLLGSLLLSLLMSFSALAAVDINSAGQSELESVKGIGPAKAKAILEHRQKNGPFKTLDDLQKVKGFGKASVNRLRDQLSVSTAAGGTAKP